MTTLRAVQPSLPPPTMKHDTLQTNNNNKLDVPSSSKYDLEESDDAGSDCFFPPASQRLAPVGAAQEEAREAAKMPGMKEEDATLKRKLREMEEEQEELNASLMAMTSHFAKVDCCAF